MRRNRTPQEIESMAAARLLDRSGIIICDDLLGKMLVKEIMSEIGGGRVSEDEPID